jgi:hypothetical protein
LTAAIDRLGQVAQRPHGPVEVLAQRAAEVDPAVLVRGAHGAQVGAGGERAAGAREHDRADGVVPGVLERGEQVPGDPAS